MYILGKGKKPFLEFLRNLTPQILLLTIALLVGVKIDFTSFDFDNTIPTATFYIVLGVFLMSFYANSALLIESCLESIKWLPRFELELKVKGVKGFQWVFAVCAQLWKRQKLFVIELTISILVVQVGMVAVLFSAITGSSSIFKQLGG